MVPDVVAAAPPRLLVIVGPTGTGKSNLAVGVAEEIGGEIVGCDSLQIYREFDVGTAKPSKSDRARVPHHLVDLLDPRHDGTLAEYVGLAEEALLGIRDRGSVPVIVGGTGLYLRGLLRGILSAPPRDPRLRERLRAMGERYGPGRLHRWLRGVDPASAERIGEADAQRIVRGLELALTTDSTWGERLRQEGTWDRLDERFPNLKVGLDMSREELWLRLHERVDRFFADGLVDEVRRLLETVPREAGAFKAIGYREVVACLDAGRDPEEARERVKRNTRRYARKQRSWFRREPGVQWLDASESNESLVRQTLALWRDAGVEE